MNRKEVLFYGLQFQHSHLGIGHPRHLVHRLVVEYRLYGLVDDAVAHGEHRLPGFQVML